jgi:hypothetical protein
MAHREAGSQTSTCRQGRRSQVLTDGRAQTGAPGGQTQVNDEHIIADDVAEIRHQRHDQGMAALLAAQEPAEKGKVGEHGRGRQNPGIEIGAAGVLDFRAAAEQREAELAERPLQ